MRRAAVTLAPHTPEPPHYVSHSGWSGMAYVSYSPFGGPGAMGHAATTSYGYDGVQRPASLAHAFSGGAGSVVWTFGRNPAGQLSSVARDNDAFAWTRHYGVQRPYTTNGRNQYSATGSGQAATNFTYDDNGNLTSETTMDVTRTYTYDIENRLIGASVPGGSQVQLGYDPLGRLSWTTGSPDFTRFLYDGDALIAEYDYSGTTMTKRYAHWVGADVPLVSYEGASLANAAGRWLFADHQGSIIAAAHPSGATDWVNTYDEYGIPGAGNSGRFQYTGQIWLPELGMYHYKARVYSPTLGRFLQTDPVGYQDQFNLYAYVGNDPVNLTDPSGIFRDIYIGGMSDGRSRIVASYAERQQAIHPERDIRYFSWTDYHGIDEAIASTPANEPINMIGHSLGGARAIETADLSDRRIANLVTIDPVQLFVTRSGSDNTLNNVEKWVNVTANPTDRNVSDMVASIGGKVDQSITNQAGLRISSGANHGDFARMMNEARAQRAIDDSYRRPRRD